MLHCDICTRKCSIGEGRCGACGQYEVVRGKLVERFADHYLVTSPISAETMPLLHGWPGAVFLQISTVGCNLSCPGCISSILVQGMVAGEHLLKHLSPDQVVQRAIENDCAGIVFLMNDPLASYITFSRVAQEAKKNGLRVGCSTNGLFTEASLSRLMPYLDFVNIGMKGMKDSSYGECGAASSEPVLRNIKTLVDTGVHVEVACILRTDNHDELRSLAHHVASVSPNIPLQVMRFIPLEDADLSLEPNIAAAEAFCQELSRTMGFVYLFNSPGTRRLDTICPDCGKIVIRRDFYGPMGAKLLAANEPFPESGRCPHCDADLCITGGIQARNFQEKGFEGGYPFTRALEMVEAMLGALGLFHSTDMVRAWNALLQNGGLQRFHHDVQDPDTYIAALRRFGTLGNREDRADLLAGHLEHKLAWIASAIKDVSYKPRVYYAMGTPLFALNPSRLENRLVMRAGGVSVNAELEGEGRPGRTIDIETLNRLNPDVIFISAFIGEPVHAFYRRCLTLGVTAEAVQNHRIYEHPAPGWDFGSPRWILGLMFITHVLHPDRFSPDIMAEARDFYRLFYDMDFDLLSVNRSFSKPSKNFRKNMPPAALRGPDFKNLDKWVGSGRGYKEISSGPIITNP
jgi:pyruvate formate lyase activating enzyme